MIGEELRFTPIDTYRVDTVKSFMKKIALIPLEEKRESLGWLELELSKGSAQARKKWGGRLHEGSKNLSG